MRKTEIGSDFIDMRGRDQTRWNERFLKLVNDIFFLLLEAKRQLQIEVSSDQKRCLSAKHSSCFSSAPDARSAKARCHSSFGPSLLKSIEFGVFNKPGWALVSDSPDLRTLTHFYRAGSKSRWYISEVSCVPKGGQEIPQNLSPELMSST